MPSKVDRTGFRYGDLTVVREGERQVTKGGYVKATWVCLCDCGKETTVRTDNLSNGTTRSCGCKGGNYRHGHKVGCLHGGKSTPTYMTWEGMKHRCLDKNHKRYNDYGGKGVTICEQWLGYSGFNTFLSDMGERPDGCTLDRIDNAKGYSPDNCRWATAKEQYQNKRVVRDALGRFNK